jgi:hypothetical protein
MNEIINYQTNFISKEQQDDLIDYLLPLFNKPTTDVKIGFRNKVIRFGSKAPYSSDHAGIDIPEIFKQIAPNIKFTSVTINEYYPGQSLAYHIDAPPSEQVFIISLCSSARLFFRNRIDNNNEINFLLEPLSLFVLEGRLRWLYEHKLMAENYRISIVYR